MGIRVTREKGEEQACAACVPDRVDNTPPEFFYSKRLVTH